MKNEKLSRLFNNADSISLDDEFVRYFSPCNDDDDDDEAIVINLLDERYVFSSKSCSEAIFNGDAWEIYCDEHKKIIDVCFYQVKDISNL